ncbi:hypothetical protein M501DRAFT_903040, partial [Patellaria atrata CBS 101060]
SAASPNPSPQSLPPLVTSPPLKTPGSQRIPSYANKRLSTFSTVSSGFSKSRPQSSVFPVFHSSLPYALVRDFAYPQFHPLHYGPLPEDRSEVSTPASERQRRLSDPPPTWEGSRGNWSATPWGSGEQLPQTSFGDGPPWSEDEDLHSPVVTSARHKKHKSNTIDFDHNRGRSRDSRGSYTTTNGDGSQTVYRSDPGGDYITYPPNSARHGQQLAIPSSGDDASRRDSHFAATLPSRTYADAPSNAAPYDHEMDSPDDDEPDDDFMTDESRFSRDYQFTIASPDEEYHGKAVALFDFARENENELPLIEGQVILVSYRQSQGWLVAQDPKTGESGLVPEEYVRLLRDIEGGLNGLMNGVFSPLAESQNRGALAHSGAFAESPAEAKTPTQAEMPGHKRSGSGTGQAHYTPVVSTFSTSSKDLELVPGHLLGSQVST